MREWHDQILISDIYIFLNDFSSGNNEQFLEKKRDGITGSYFYMNWLYQYFIQSVCMCACNVNIYTYMYTYIY